VKKTIHQFAFPANWCIFLLTGETDMNNGSPNGVVNSKQAKHKSKGRASYDKAEQNHKGKYKLGRGVGPFISR
jgi:hypothetical protein